MLKLSEKTCLSLRRTKLMLALIFSLVFSVPSWPRGYPDPTLPFEQGSNEKAFIPTYPPVRSPYDDQRHTIISRHGEGRPGGEEVERWESLPPEKRLELRRRMERWKELSPEDQDLFRRRYKQWQELSPGERQRMRDELKDWDTLSPGERERIRRKFQGR
jgi:hypothetical protein